MNRRTTVLAWVACLMLGLLPLAVPTPAHDGYRKVEGPCGLTFPEDHAAHPQYKTEWWYYTGNLQSEAGEPFGFQFTIFRTALRPPGSGNRNRSPSAWRADQIFIGHTAVTDVDRKVHRSAETSARGALDLAGVRTGGEAVSVYVRNWRTDITPTGHHLRAEDETLSLDLVLTPAKPPVLHGRGGYSQKGAGRDRASCYYSLTRLNASGSIRAGDRVRQVQGTAWMDHEFSTSPLEPGLVGWDWFSLQLTDRTELMVYMLRNEDGTFHPASAGTFVHADGEKEDLKRDQLTVDVIDRWRSPATDTDYPVRWRLSVSSPDLDLMISARINDQEMNTRQTTGVVYWEGSVTAEGMAAGGPVSGAGYVEMTGYEGPFDAPM